MLDLRPFNTLGRFRNDWLDAHYHFSFADYHDPARMGLGPLRVWNDDTIRAGTGFPPHPHRDMEIITYIRSGAITHTDGLGNTGETATGNVQVMSAGTGIVHSEENRSPDDMTLFQIWIIPARRSVSPRWENKVFPSSGGTLSILASGRECDSNGEGLIIHQDAAVLGGFLPAGTTWVSPMTGRAAYLVPTRGRLKAESASGTVEVGPRDGLMVLGEDGISLTATEDAEVVLVDVAAPDV